jgi:probable HAF family extracellular repeat protein
MKFRTLKYITALTLFLALAVAAGLRAQNQLSVHGFPRYQIIPLGSLGGTVSSGNTINNIGSPMGFSVTSDGNVHAAIWSSTSPTDLGTLGGPNSNIGWPVKNNRGVIAGVSEFSDTLDPLGEEFSCPVLLPPTGFSCVGFVIHNGVMSALPTLGGNNGFATGVNGQGLAVGWAENTVHDPTCSFPQVLQFEAVIYGPAAGQIQQLPPFDVDPDSAATAINDSGQVVGISGLCDVAIGALSAQHALLWQDGKPVNIGNLGGGAFNTPMAINNRGQIAGFSDLPGDVVDGVLTNVNFHAFFWTKPSGIVEIKPLAGDEISEATGINNQGVVIGTSFTAGFASARAFLWQNGQIEDLNSLAIPGSNLFLITTGDINDSGEITGQACVLSNGSCSSEIVAFLGIPVWSGSAGEVATSSARANTPAARVLLPESARQMVLRRHGLSRMASRLTTPS